MPSKEQSCDYAESVIDRLGVIAYLHVAASVCRGKATKLESKFGHGDGPARWRKIAAILDAAADVINREKE